MNLLFSKKNYWVNFCFYLFINLIYGVYFLVIDDYICCISKFVDNDMEFVRLCKFIRNLLWVM